MAETDKRSVRLLLDLQACQTRGSAGRGVGRYSEALFSHLVGSRGHRDVFALLSNGLPLAPDLESVSEARILRLDEMPDWGTNRNHQGGEQDALDALAYSSFAGPISADLLHVSHVFEGFNERVALPSPSLRAAGQVLSATLFDLIPLLFQEHYFNNPDFKKWYLARLAWLRQADLLLAISESSRRDAIALLGMEPWRIVTVHGGVGAHFCPGNDPQAERERLSMRYRLPARFVLYAGGDDHRKNIAGAIAGYAEIPAGLRTNCQLVIVCSMEEQRKQMYLHQAHARGLGAAEIQITGFVPEADLVSFYRTCSVFMFPSLYEGLGLPVLEAMACGAAVVGGNNSSIREIIARDDALFDAASPGAIAATVGRALGDKGFANHLRSHGMARASEFSWQRTADLAHAAFDEALQRSRTAGVSTVVQGWVARKRLAMLTPLPPCRSGIADYNAQFLPYLARHFDIDLYVDDHVVTDAPVAAAFRLFSAKDFAASAHMYDAILYEFGNSEFHAHMLPLLERFPGIVGIHDAFVGGLVQYADFVLGQTGRYNRDLLDAHGPLARRFIAPRQGEAHPNDVSDQMLPCSKRLLTLATGVISHSPFNLDVARRFYPEGWQAPYRIIPQMVPVPGDWTEVEREKTRARLGFSTSDTIITTFGHIVWTKWCDLLLQAFDRSALRENANVHLVFAGELPNNAFGRGLRQAADHTGLGTRIRITGFLTEEDYEGYLRISDLAVQLRTRSRGGTPKTVLDCLVRGLPVIVNNDASYTDYPDNVVIKLEATPSVESIAHELVRTTASPERRTMFSRAGAGHAREHHSPARCAAEYAAAIHEFSARHKAAQRFHGLRGFAPHMAGCQEPTRAAEAAAGWLQRIPVPAFERRRLFIDVTELARSDAMSGIQRVVGQIVTRLYCSARTGFEPVAVALQDGCLKKAVGWLDGQGLLCAHEQPGESIRFAAGDVLLMLDSTWLPYRQFMPIFQQARDRRVPIYTVVYDLLPLQQPEQFVPKGSRLQWYEDWFHAAVAESDGLLCISRSVADEVDDYLSRQLKLARKPKLGYWHLGADFLEDDADHVPAPAIIDLASGPFLLMVGTIEPRKSHALALAAMERLWSSGSDLRLCVAGKEGWMVSELMARLRNHPQLGRRLFLIESPIDADLGFLYRNAVALLFPSTGEGFGLPLVEAANHGLPILCSDIPVFHEIAGDHAIYLDRRDPGAVASKIEEMLARKKSGRLPDSRNMPRLSWEQSAEALLDVVLENKWIELVR